MFYGIKKLFRLIYFVLFEVILSGRFFKGWSDDMSKVKWQKKRDYDMTVEHIKDIIDEDIRLSVKAQQGDTDGFTPEQENRIYEMINYKILSHQIMDDSPLRKDFEKLKAQFDYLRQYLKLTMLTNIDKNDKVTSVKFTEGIIEQLRKDFEEFKKPEIGAEKSFQSMFDERYNNTMFFKFKKGEQNGND